MSQGLHPGTKAVLEFFAYDHLPEDLQSTSRAFSELAADVVVAAPNDPETTVALRKLLEAKDAAVRARLRCAKNAARALGG